MLQSITKGCLYTESREISHHQPHSSPTQTHTHIIHIQTPSKGESCDLIFFLSFLVLLKQLPQVPSDSATVPVRLAVCHHGRQPGPLSVSTPAAFANRGLIQKLLLLHGVRMTEWLPVIASGEKKHVPVPQTLYAFNTLRLSR